MFSNISKYIFFIIPIAFLILFCGLSFAIIPLYIIAFMGSLILFTFIFFYVDFGIYMALVINPFDRLTSIGAESPITFVKIILIFVGLILLIKTIILKDTRFIRKIYDNPVTIFGFVFLIFSFISILNATDLEIFVLQMVRRLSCIILLFILINIVNSEKKLFNIFQLLILSFFFVGMTGIYELWSGQSILVARFGTGIDHELPTLPGQGVRITGPYGDAPFYSAAFIMPSALCVYFFYVNKSNIQKSLLFFLFLFFIFNILGTNARGGLIGLVLSLGAFCLLLEYKRKLFIAFVASAAVIMTIITYKLIVPDASFERYTGESGWKSIEWRIGLIEMSTEIIRENPFFGIGTGNFISLYQNYANNNEKVPIHPLLPHNSILQVWAENGIFGLISYLCVFFFSFRNSLIVVYHERDRNLKAAAVAIFAITVGLFFFAAVSNTIENQDYWIVFAFSVIIFDIHKNRSLVPR